MPNYMTKALTKVQHVYPSKPQNTPNRWILPIYGKITQNSMPHDNTHLLDNVYARAIDNTILPTLNQIVTNQASPL